ncbi:MAG: helix-turn-helix domain-containing protein, partial [Thermoguttaceae bacterium]|nr:helix-turn-helix domain-containing protein [Thermoguttaceae bacterium]
LTYKEAGALLRVGRTKLSLLVKKGIVPVVRIGSSVFFRRASLLVWIEKQEQKERRLDA